MAGRRQRERDDYGGQQADEYGRAGGGGERDDYGQAWDSGYRMVQPGSGGDRWPGRRTLTDGMERAVIPRMEQAFGQSFGDVRVRTDEAAADKADRMGARAWAEADEIGFARGEFRPDTRDGLHTIAHEFAHIAQGRGGTGGELGPVSLATARGRARDGASADAVEADADRAAEAVVNGERAVVAPVELSFARRKAVAAASAGPEPPPRGSVFISPVGNGWMMVWNGDDVRRWNGDARVRVLSELARTVFPGASEAVVAAFVASPRGVVEWGNGAFDARRYRERVLLVHILPELHAGMLDWMEDNHPELAAAAITPGFRPVGGAGGRKGGRGKALEEGGAGKAGERAGVDGDRVGSETRAGSSGGGVEKDGSSEVDPTETFPPAARLLGPEPGSIHVAGAKVRFEVQHDFDDPRYPKRWLLHVPGHASYHWKISVGGKSAPLEVDTPDRVVHLPLVFGPGHYVFAVTPRSRHFGTYPALVLTHAVEVHSEKARDREVFDASLPGSPFERSGETLAVREGAAAPSPEREIDSLRHELDEVAGAASQLSPEVLKLYQAQTQRQIKAQQRIAKQHQGQQPYLVHGTFLSRENSTSVPLKLSMYAKFGQLPGDQTTCVLTVHDSTLSPGEPKQAVGLGLSHASDPEVAQAAAERTALDVLKSQWHSHNDYPNGTLHLAVQLQHGDHAVRELSFDTSSTLRTVRSVLGTVASAAGLALLVLPGGGVLSAGLLIVSGAAGTASTLLSLQHRAETEGGLHADGKLALDLLSLATNFASLGGFTQTIQRGSGLVRGMYYGSMAGLAGAQGYLIAAETKAAVADLEAQFAVQIARAPEAERQSLRKQRDHAIASAIGDAIISGGFLLVSVAGIIKDSLARRGSDVRPYVEEAALSASPERIAELLRNDAEGKASLTAGERRLLESVAGTPGTRTAGGEETWPATKQEPGQTGQTSGAKPRIVEPVPGVYEDVDPEHRPSGWQFEDGPLRTERDGTLVIRTNVRHADGTAGWLERAYNPETGQFEMRNAFMGDLPSWIESGGTPMVPGRGTPTIAYLTMRQMKILGVNFGELPMVKLTKIQNIEAIAHLANLTRRKGLPVDQAVLKTIDYAETAIVQSGQRVVSAKVVGGVETAFQELLSHFEASDGPGSAPDPAVVAANDAVLAKYKISRTDLVLWNYTIWVTVQRFSGPAAPPGVQP